jgi:transcriptional regulator with XRE-family HTH domain
MAAQLKPLTPELSPLHRFGATLRELRIRAGYKQPALAGAVYTSKSTISRAENGIRLLSRTLAEACDAELNASGLLLMALDHASQLLASPAAQPRLARANGQSGIDPLRDARSGDPRLAEQGRRSPCRSASSRIGSFLPGPGPMDIEVRAASPLSRIPGRAGIGSSHELTQDQAHEAPYAQGNTPSIRRRWPNASEHKNPVIHVAVAKQPIEIGPRSAAKPGGE